LQKISEGRRAEERMTKEIEKVRDQLKAWEAFCKSRGEKPADMALAWLLQNPVVTAPIIGPRTIEQLTGALRALKIKLNKTDLKKLDEIWPGPGGAAPEAYAW
jgi:aryl-alcohol dehydrogenase-like predicted oxidoreductase